jgi:hypothetical protein
MFPPEFLEKLRPSLRPTWIKKATMVEGTIISRFQVCSPSDFYQHALAYAGEDGMLYLEFILEEKGLLIPWQSSKK